MLVMHIGVVIHGIGKIRLVCGHAIDETNQRAVLYTRGERGIVVIGVDQQPEMVRISGHACGKAFVACGLRRWEAGGLHSLDRVQILHRCMSNEHVHTRKAYPIFTFRYAPTAQSANMPYCRRTLEGSQDDCFAIPDKSLYEKPITKLARSGE